MASSAHDSDPFRLRIISRTLRLPELYTAYASSLTLTVAFSSILLLLAAPAVQSITSPLVALIPHDTLFLQPFWSRLRASPYVASPIFPGVFTAIYYWAACLPFAAVDLFASADFKKRHRLQPASPQRPDAWAHALGLTLWHHAAFIIPGLATSFQKGGPWLAYHQTGNSSAWCMEDCDGLALLPSSAPPLAELLLHLFLCFVLFDAFYFYWHRLHHLSPLLYKHIHSVHHEYRAPFCWVTQHEHVLELLPVSIWSVLVPIGLQCHPLTQWIFMVLATQASIEAHSGYNYGIGRMLEWLIGSSKAFTSWSVHHDNHHKVPKCNHEPFFTYLDRWFGTLYLEEGSSSSSSKLEETPQAQPQPPLPTLDIADVTPVPPEDGKPTESLLCHTADTFAAAVVSRLGRGEVLARALYRSYYASADLSAPRLPPEVAAASTALSARLIGLCDLAPPLRFAQTPPKLPSPGETEKYVLCCKGGEEVEMVAMPAPGGENAGWSLCVSSQVGCRMGCAFCETGRMGLLRNLTTAEIVSQVAHATSSLRLKVTNVIYMGMGEPLDNADAVIESIKVLTDPSGLGVALSHITVSTSGVASKVQPLMESLPSVRLAFSLHAANDTLRSSLMPINKKTPLKELAEAMRSYLKATKRRVTIQYVLLAGVNDGKEHAEELAQFLLSIGPASRFHLNLIPYNAQSGTPRFEAPTHDACKEFKTALAKPHGLFVKIREEKGANKMAACGQLGNVALKRTLMLKRRMERMMQREAAEEQEAEAADAAADAAAAAASVEPEPPEGAYPVRVCGREDLSW